jgi:hypothetical protein
MLSYGKFDNLARYALKGAFIAHGWGPDDLNIPKSDTAKRIRYAAQETKPSALPVISTVQSARSYPLAISTSA